MSAQGSAPSAQIAQFRADGASGATGLRIPFFADAFSRSFGFPDTRPLNMIAEATPVREERPYAAFVGLREVLYTRPALVAGFNLGAGPIRGNFHQPGVFGGAQFVVSGADIYMDGVGVGLIPGTDIVRFAASPTQVIAVSSGVAWLWDGTATHFRAIANGVLPPVIDAAYLGDRFVFVCAGSTTAYYSELGDGASELGLDFFNVEDSPANLVAVTVLNDKLMFLSQDRCEFWSVTSDADAPFTPDEGQGFQRGCASRDTVCFADNAIFWLGDNGVIYRAANNPDRISNSSIEDKIRQCPDWRRCNAFVATFEGHEHYVLNIWGVGSYAYDISRVGVTQGAYGDSFSRGEWKEWSSYQHIGFRARLAVTVNGVVYVGDDTTGDVWRMKENVWTDAGGPLVRRVSAFIKIEEGTPRMDSLILHCVPGVGNAIDPGANPLVEMRYSDDMGAHWSKWRARPLGKLGKQATRVQWQHLGQMRAPGRLIEVRCSESVDVAFSHLELNPARPAN